MQEIPLTSDGAQVFSIDLDSILYDFRVIYNTRLNLWSLDVSSNGEELANGLALVGGVDVTDAYNLTLKNLVAVNTTESKLDANADNLGTDIKLFLLTDEEVESVSSV